MVKWLLLLGAAALGWIHLSPWAAVAWVVLFILYDRTNALQDRVDELEGRLPDHPIRDLATQVGWPLVKQVGWPLIKTLAIPIALLAAIGGALFLYMAGFSSHFSYQKHFVEESNPRLQRQPSAYYADGTPIPAAEWESAVSSGQARWQKGESIKAYAPDGQKVLLPPEEYQKALAAGYRIASPEEVARSRGPQ